MGVDITISESVIIVQDGDYVHYDDITRHNALEKGGKLVPTVYTIYI